MEEEEKEEGQRGKKEEEELTLARSLRKREDELAPFFFYALSV